MTQVVTSHVRPHKNILPAADRDCDNVRETVKVCLRESLASSNVAAVAIAALMLSSFDAGFRALWELIFPILEFLGTAILIRDIPYFSGGSFVTAMFYVWASLICMAGAWLLSKWIYGTGPLQLFSQYRGERIRTKHV